MIGSYKVVDHQEDTLRGDSADVTNYILQGPLIDSLKSLPELIPFSGVKMIIYDLSRVLKGAKLKVLLKYSDLENSDEPSFFKRLFREWKEQDFSFVFQVVKNLLTVLINDGFFVVRVNGTIKHHIKIILDQLIGESHFVNEIFFDSQYCIQYTDENNIIERSEYFLVYSKSKNPIIKSVYNEKTSGGYWHSFVSKGQGGPKEFIIEGKPITLSPPAGNHWKLKQETILELCKEGKIRLNTKGNPEYWVPRKKGQIIDTNWLDLVPLANYNLRNSSCSLLTYTRLLETLVNPTGRILLISPQSSDILTHMSTLEYNWISLFEDIPDPDDLNNKLAEKRVNYDLIRVKTKEIKRIAPYISNEKMKLKFPKSSSLKHDFSKGDEFIYFTKDIAYPRDDNNWKNKIILGDCLNVLQNLHESLKNNIKLIYIDPPFFTGVDETMYVPIGNLETSDIQEGTQLFPPIEILAYENVLTREEGVEKFTEWFSERIRLMKPLLRSDGFIFVRFDYHFGHYAKIILDEVFGVDNFLIEFIIRRMKKNLSIKQINQQTHLIVHSDSLFVYRVSPYSVLNMSKIKKIKRKNQDAAEIEYFNDNLWLDIAGYQKVKKTSYPSENSESLLKRIIEISTSEGDIIADFFAGSGTTLAVAEKLNRKWVGVDIGTHAVNEIRKRILEFESFQTFSLRRLYDESDEKPAHQLLSDKLKAIIDIGIDINELKVEISIKNFISPDFKPKYKSLAYLGMIDYWEIDWNYTEEEFKIDWYSYRKIKEKKVIKFVSKSVSHTYERMGDYLLVVNIVDIFGNFYQQKQLIKLE